MNQERPKIDFGQERAVFKNTFDPIKYIIQENQGVNIRVALKSAPNTMPLLVASRLCVEGISLETLAAPNFQALTLISEKLKSFGLPSPIEGGVGSIKCQSPVCTDHLNGMEFVTSNEIVVHIYPVGDSCSLFIAFPQRDQNSSITEFINSIHIIKT